MLGVSPGRGWSRIEWGTASGCMVALTEARCSWVFLGASHYRKSLGELFEIAPQSVLYSPSMFILDPCLKSLPDPLAHQVRESQGQRRDGGGVSRELKWLLGKAWASLHRPHLSQLWSLWACLFAPPLPGPLPPSLEVEMVLTASARCFPYKPEAPSPLSTWAGVSRDQRRGSV